jgi:hypothetical protein
LATIAYVLLGAVLLTNLKEMYSAKSFQLTKGEFNYLLPVLRNKLHQSGDRCYFIADNIDALTDMLNRLKGHYDNYDELKNMIDYHCSKNGSLNPFRESMGLVLS